MSKRMYAILGPDGNFVGIENSERSAIEAAGRLAPEVIVEGVGGPGHTDLGAALPVTPERAQKLAGLPTIKKADIQLMSLEHAHSILRPYFPATQMVKGKEKPVARWQNPDEMVDAFLRQNYKTAKETPLDPSDVLGLNLQPYTVARQHDKSLKFQTLCAGASKECMDSCLAFSGMNILKYNNLVKQVTTAALIEQPRAFARILLEACRRHAKRSGKSYESFIRLNVLSDIPWELVFPSLFDELPNLQFYDYTKVPGRQVPKNYDLTFSFSGTNEDLCIQEVRKHQRRVAVVFLPPLGNLRYREPENGNCPPGFKMNPLGICTPALPKTFRGLPVVDGDVSDVRPRDPAPCIVGLRWKIPIGKGISHEDVHQQVDEGNAAFVIPIGMIDGEAVAVGTGSRITWQEEP